MRSEAVSVYLSSRYRVQVVLEFHDLLARLTINVVGVE